MSWQSDLIAGFPWATQDPDDDLCRHQAAKTAGLLYLIPTEHGSADEDEYGEYVFRLTYAGRAALAQSSKPEGDRS